MEASNRTQEATETEPPDSLPDHFNRVRKFSRELCKPLATEDYVVQTMPDVSPTKWHLAHTSWFFETFVLAPNVRGYESPDTRYAYLFNSYYHTVGEQHYRPHRGHITRPTVAEVFDYRAHVDREMGTFLANPPGDAARREVWKVIEIGLHHEQQHQELMLTDIKHVLSRNPTFPIYSLDAKPSAAGEAPPLGWLAYQEGVHEVGHDGGSFAYDNESPRHRVFLQAFDLASRLVTNGEYMEFMKDGGYETPTLWLSDGWNTVQARRWTSPLYWHKRDGQWKIFTLTGLRDVDANEPVCHLSFYEAEAYARWAGARLPTEFEWEVASEDVAMKGNFVDSGAYHTVARPSAPNGRLTQMFGDAWEWTQSHYSPYPGYRPPPGALGEYNGKFMCNQFVLRGGSCATSRSHIRRTYRNFFPPNARWQFSGVRLARDGGGAS